MRFWRIAPAAGAEEEVVIVQVAPPDTLVRTHLPLVDGKSSTQRRRRHGYGPSGRARLDGPLDLVDEPADRDRSRPLVTISRTSCARPPNVSTAPACRASVAQDRLEHTADGRVLVTAQASRVTTQAACGRRAADAASTSGA